MFPLYYIRYFHGSGLGGRVAGSGASGRATFGEGDTVGVGAVLLPDPAYPVAALFFTLNGAPLGPEAGQPLAPPWAECVVVGGAHVGAHCRGRA